MLVKKKKIERVLTNSHSLHVEMYDTRANENPRDRVKTELKRERDTDYYVVIAADKQTTGIAIGVSPHLREAVPAFATFVPLAKEFGSGGSGGRDDILQFGGGKMENLQSLFRAVNDAALKGFLTLNTGGPLYTPTWSSRDGYSGCLWRANT